MTRPTITVFIPGPMELEALASCAIEGNRFAIDALETIRRAEAGEPVGECYVRELNAWVEKASEKR